MRIREATVHDGGAVSELRHALWPETGVDVHLEEIAATTGPGTTFLAIPASKQPCGFVEVTIRHDYVNGCETSPVAFVEGIYVIPERRGNGIGRRLLDAVRTWASERGCVELASDALLDNLDSHRFHEAVGFEETERVVYFRVLLERGNADSK